MFGARNILFKACIGFALMHPAASLAQSDRDWRAVLPAENAPNRFDAPSAERADIGTIAFDDARQLAPETPPLPPIRLGSVLIDPDRKIDHAMFDRVIEPHLGKIMSHEELTALAQQIADAARANGMILATAHIPVQTVELGIVRINLQVGVLDEVRLDGSNSRALKAVFAPLVGRPLLHGNIERKLLLAGDLPQIVVRQAEIQNDGGRQILVIRVDERPRLRGKLVADNYGSDAIGPLRARLSVEAVSLLDESDFANVTFRANPADPRELTAASVSYGVGLGAGGTRAEISGAWSRSKFGGRETVERSGHSVYGSVAVSHPLRRTRSSNLWLDGQIEYLEIDQDALRTALQSDTVVTLSAGLSASYKLANGWLRTGTQLRMGLGIFGATRQFDLLASKANADGQFLSGRAWANWSGEVASDVSLRIAVTGQIAAEPLLVSEEMGLGGPFAGRAFDFYERAGDRGVAALAEIGYVMTNPKRWLKRIQPYIFADGGMVDAVGAGLADGQLVSVGGGIRGVIGAMDLQLETAFPIHADNGIRNRGDAQVNFQLGLDF